MHCLWKFVDLFQTYGTRLKKRWGPDWFELPAEEFRDDGLSLAFLKLLRGIVAIDRGRAHFALRQVYYEGLPYEQPGGQAAKYRSRDFGIEFLVALTSRIDAARN